MNPAEVEAVSRVSPTLAAIVVVATPCVGLLAVMVPIAKNWPVVRKLCLRVLKWDPGAEPPSKVTDQTMQFIDELRAELETCRKLLKQYDQQIQELRDARFGLLQTLSDLRNAALAARTQLHALERQFGLAETPFEPLPGEVVSAPSTPL